MTTTDYRQASAYLRAEIMVEADLADMPPPLREAMVFARLLQRLPIGVLPGEALAGDYGLSFAAEPLRARVASWASPPPPPAAADPFHRLGEVYHCRASFSPAHSTADYERVLRLGLEGMIAAMPAVAPEDETYRQAEIVALRAVCDWAARYAELGFPACRRVPALPPRDFAEAVQAIWLVHTAIGFGEKSDASLSLGRLDQYLLPFYRADLARGVPCERMEQALIDLFLKLNRYGDAACAVNLGGLGADGQDPFNDLTRLIVKVAIRQSQPAPILAARIHPNIRQEDFDSLTVPELFRIGQPSFYGEFACRQALRRRGVPEAELHRWAVNSCMGLMMPGEEFSDMWALVVTFILPLELALNGGRPFAGELPVTLKTAASATYADVEEIQTATLRFADELLALLIERHGEITRCEGTQKPDPYLSALLGGGIPGRDRLRGGPRHHTANVDAFGIVNVADALNAIHHVVFRDRRCTLAELVAVVKNNFAGHDAFRRELLAAPKYGNGDPKADRRVVALADGFAASVRRYSAGPVVYMPSFHTLNGHVGVGKNWGASADGRLAGEPLAKNIGPMQGRDHSGLTALLRSAAAIDQQFFYGGQAIDLHLDAALMAEPAAARKFQAALQTYFQMGGLLVQVNGVSVESLKAAMANPEAHGDLTVRIGGFSMRFVQLDPDTQREMILRFESHT
ncbi:MAG: pyruvate formate lyase family protein [Planctomycetota bacterium]